MTQRQNCGERDLKRLSYQVLEEAGCEEFYVEEGTERVLQFGAGNFLRAFVDYFIDCMNETQGFDGKVVVVQSTSGGKGAQLAEQDGLYQVYLRGREKGKAVSRRRLISCISRTIDARTEFEKVLQTAHNPQMRFIVSNTTEAGIVYDGSCCLEDQVPASFPAKLTKLLYERYRAFPQAEGYYILSCELIDDNGAELLRCVTQHARDWELGEDFCRWLKEKNEFCTTMVDRIVTGYPAAEAESLNAENGWEDQAMVVGELFGFWAIAGSKKLKEEFPLEKAGLPAVITDSVTNYKKRKVRILNGAHTSMATMSWLAGETYVRESTEHPLIHRYLTQLIYGEIIPVLPLDREDLESFAEETIDRFLNPYVQHRLLDITLNSVAKWKARVMPTLLESVEANGTLPQALTLSFVSLLSFYSAAYRWEDGRLYGRCGEKGACREYEIRDDRAVLEFFANRMGRPVDQEYLREFAGADGFFDCDLLRLPQFAQVVLQDCQLVREQGMEWLLRQKFGAEDGE